MLSQSPIVCDFETSWDILCLIFPDGFLFHEILDPSKHFTFTTSCCKNVHIRPCLVGTTTAFCSFWTWHLPAASDHLYWQWKDQREKNTSKLPPKSTLSTSVPCHPWYDIPFSYFLYFFSSDCFWFYSAHVHHFTREVWFAFFWCLKGLLHFFSWSLPSLF